MQPQIKIGNLLLSTEPDFEGDLRLEATGDQHDDGTYVYFSVLHAEELAEALKKVAKSGVLKEFNRRVAEAQENLRLANLEADKQRQILQELLDRE